MLIFPHISSPHKENNNIMITANIIQQYNMKSLRVEETQNTLIISTNIQEMLSSFVMFPSPLFLYYSFRTDLILVTPVDEASTLAADLQCISNKQIVFKWHSTSSILIIIYNFIMSIFYMYFIWILGIQQ